MDLLLPDERQRPLPHYLGAAIRFQRGEYEEARDRALSILKWAPDYALTWLLLSRSEDRLGRVQEAEKALASFERSADAPLAAGAQRAVLFARQGRAEESRTVLRTLEEARASGYVSPALLARVYASLGDVERALAALEDARAEHSFSLLFLDIDPDYELLRSDERFRALVDSIRLAVQ